MKTRRELQQVTARLSQDRHPSYGEELKVVLLSGPADGDTVLLPRAIVNDQKAQTGTGNGVCPGAALRAPRRGDSRRRQYVRLLAKDEDLRKV